MNSMVERCQSVIRSDVARTLVVKERVEVSDLLNTCFYSLICFNLTTPNTAKQNSLLRPYHWSCIEGQDKCSYELFVFIKHSNKRSSEENNFFEFCTTIKQEAKTFECQLSESTKLWWKTAMFGRALVSTMARFLVSSFCYLLTPPFMFTSGKNNTLDLTSPGAIPVHFAKAMTHLSSDLQLPLSLTYTTEERAILTKTIRAKSLNDIQGIVKDIRLVPRVGLQSYIYIALSKL